MAGSLRRFALAPKYTHKFVDEIPSGRGDHERDHKDGNYNLVEGCRQTDSGHAHLQQLSDDGAGIDCKHHAALARNGHTDQHAHHGVKHGGHGTHGAGHRGGDAADAGIQHCVDPHKDARVYDCHRLGLHGIDAIGLGHGGIDAHGSTA